MKIALVTFDFDADRHGGVSSVCFRIFESIRNGLKSDIEVISFSNSRRDANSISFLRFRSYRNNRISRDGFYLGAPVTRIGSVGSEFEFMRYRRRRELTKYFRQFDLIIVVTGVLQFANVLPKLDVPIVIQCATRLTWERKSQYEEMTKLKRFFLKLQLPLLSLQERRVLGIDATILVENSKMQKWVQTRAFNEPILWYPGIRAQKEELQTLRNSNGKGYYISVGRLNESRKGWNRLFLAYKEAYDNHKGLPDLVIIGSGSFSKDTREILTSLLPRYPIKVLGKLSDHDRDSMFCGASYFLQTSHEEGLGLAALEALSFGIPLICSATDGSKEYVIEGVSGILVEQSSNFIQNFSQAIILSQTWDYAALSRSSLELFYKVFDLQISQERLMKIISSRIRNRH
jgi:glycosyltransferase involved in cell wall biosynthesis